MELPIYNFQVAIDYTEFISELEKEKGYDTRDMGKFLNSSDYLDFWHWCLDNCFSNFQRGGVTFMNRDWLDSNATPPWVKIILTDIFNAVPTDHPAYDQQFDCINFCIDW